MSRQKKTLFEVKISGVPNGNKYWYIIGRPNEKRIRAWFDSDADAKAESQKQNSQLENYGSKSFTLSASQRAQAEEAICLLTPYGLSLVDAAQAVISRLELASKSITIRNSSLRPKSTIKPSSIGTKRPKDIWKIYARPVVA